MPFAAICVPSMSPTARFTLNVLPTNSTGFHALPRRGAVALVTTVLAVVLLFSFKPADPATELVGGIATSGPSGPSAPSGGGKAPQRTSTTPFGPPAPTGPPPGGGPGNAARTATPEPPRATPTPGSNAASGTFTGKAVDTPYGTLQVALVVQGGQIVDVQ